MNTKRFRKWQYAAVAAAGMGCATGAFAAEEVDDALKGRDLNTIMKLLQAEGEESPTPPPAPEVPEAKAPVAEPPPVKEAEPVKETPVPEPAPAKVEPEVVTPSAAPAVSTEEIPDPQRLSSEELDQFRAQLAREMEAAKAAEEARAESIKRQANAAKAPVSAPAEPPVVPAVVPETVVIAESAPVVAKAEVEEKPKKRGFFGRIFGSSKDDDRKNAKASAPAGSRVDSVKVSAETAPARPNPVSKTRPGAGADAMKKNREALEGLLSSSRDDVVKMAMGQASGQAPAGGISAPDVDPDAWKKAGPNAWRYNGEWQRGSMHGQGRLVYADGWEYVGSWKNGSMDGQGMLTMPDGTKYEGQWVEGRMHGFGKLSYPDGWQFIGQWRDGRISGQGTLIHPGE